MTRLGSNSKALERRGQKCGERGGGGDDDEEDEDKGSSFSGLGNIVVVRAKKLDMQSHVGP